MNSTQYVDLGESHDRPIAYLNPADAERLGPAAGGVAILTAQGGVELSVTAEPDDACGQER